MNHRPPELGAKLAYFYLVIISFCVLIRDIAVAAWDTFVDWAQHILKQRRAVWHAYAHPELSCQRCGTFGATHRRQNTQYVDDERNFATLCPPCQEQEDEYWDEMWREYRAGCC